MTESDPQRPVIRDKRRIDPLTGEVRDGTVADGAADGGAAAGGQMEEEPLPSWLYGPSTAEQAAAAYSEQSAAQAEGVSPAWSYAEEQQPVQPQAPAEEDVPAAVPAAGGDQAEDLRRQLLERTADLQRVQAEYANYRRRVDRDRESVKEQALVNVLGNLLPLLDDVSRARDHGDLTGGFKSVGESLEAIVEKLGLVRFGEAGEPFDPTVHEALTHSYADDVEQATAIAVFQPGFRLGDKVLRPARVAVAEPES